MKTENVTSNQIEEIEMKQFFKKLKGVIKKMLELINWANFNHLMAKEVKSTGITVGHIIVFIISAFVLMKLIETLIYIINNDEYIQYEILGNKPKDTK